MHKQDRKAAWFYGYEFAAGRYRERGSADGDWEEDAESDWRGIPGWWKNGDVLTDRRVTLTFTHKQLEALAYMVGNSADYDDIMRSLFDNRNARSRARRVASLVKGALEKIQHDRVNRTDIAEPLPIRDAGDPWFPGRNKYD